MPPVLPRRLRPLATPRRRAGADDLRRPVLPHRLRPLATPLLAPLARFARSPRGGATALTAALVAVMLLGGTALVSDHLWMVGQRDLLRGAAEAASVAAVQEMKTLPESWTDTKVKTHLTDLAERYARYNVLENAPSKTLEADDIKVDLTVSRAQGAIAVRVSADTGGTLLSRYLYGVTGPSEMIAKAGSEVRTKAVEVVLAIDVSHSMKNKVQGGSETRIAVVKRAAQAMLTTLDVGDGPVAMGIVPWERMVRLDATLRSDWTADGVVALPAKRTYRAPWRDSKSASNAVEQSLPSSPSETWRGCLEQRALDTTVGGVPLGISASVPTSSAPIPQWMYPAQYGRAYACYEPTHADYDWMQCYDATSKTDNSSHDVVSDRVQDGCSATFPAMIPLSTDATTLGEKIKGLTYSGREGRYTYSAPGIAWGMRMLDPAWRTLWGGETHPVNASDRAYLSVNKVLVLLTDGEDKITEQPSHVDVLLGHSLSSLQSSACTAAKAAGIDIYVIGVIPEAKIGQTLRDAFVACSSATDSTEADDYVFLGAVTDTEIEDTFATIATRLTSLRRTH